MELPKWMEKSIEVYLLSTNNRRSISGYIVFLSLTPISWSSRKQPIVSCSSIEAEYRAAICALSEMSWITHLFKDLHIPLSAAPKMPCNNLGIIYSTKNPVHHTKWKPLEVDLNFVHHHFRNGLVRVAHNHSTDQIADTLTKLFSKATF
ncbi:hypothetical protein KY289_001228 [Solanum tuberosum]|nr:hypothetical protein KY289_001228 [Solanum tuberosum]